MTPSSMTTPDSPLVSIIIPTYNRADLLRLTLESVISQTYANIEIILVDDGSSDHSAEVARSFDGRLKYIYQENQGTDAALRNGFQASSGKYISFLDHDDLIMPTKIEKQVRLLEKNPKIGLCHCGHFYIDREGNWIQNYCLLPDKNILKELVMADFIWSGAALVRREVILDVGLHDQSIWCSDWDFWLRIALKGYEFAVIQQPLGAYRILKDSQMANVNGLASGMQVTLDKLFSNPILPKKLQALKNGAYSRYYFEASCAYYRVNRGEEGKEFLERAIALMTHDQRTLKPLANMLAVASFGFRVQDPIAFIEMIFSNLPQNLPVDRNELYLHVMALAHLGLALRLYSQKRAVESQAVIESMLRYMAQSRLGDDEIIELSSRVTINLPLHDPVHFFRKWFDSPPKNLIFAPDIWRKMLARVCMEDALLQYYAENYSRAWKNATLSCFYHPGNLRNKGILAILVKGPMRFFKYQPLIEQNIPFRSTWEN